MRKSSQSRAIHLVILMLCAIPAIAQLEIGENVKINLNGNVGYGYTGGFSNDAASSVHSSGVVADANLTGSYFHPNFLSFSLHPYFDRSQSNSDSQAITRSTGIGGDLSLFGGSRFPGTITYGRDFSSNSQFTFAGVPSILGDTSGQNFGIAWSALIPNLPQVRASYSVGDSASSITGLTSDSTSSSKTFNLNSEYQVAGFNIQGNLSNSRNHFSSPGILTPEAISSGGGGTTYSITAQHQLPLSGSVGLGATHSTYGSDSGDQWSSNSYMAGAGFSPWRRFSFNQNISYTTNLSAMLGQSLLGGTTEPLRFGNGSNSFYSNSTAVVRLFKGLTATGYFTHRNQTLNGQDFSDSQFGGTANYNFSTPLLGLLYFSVGMVDTANKAGNQGAGLIANLGANRKFGHWDTSADFNYSQNIQTLVAISNSSAYSYGGSIKRRVNSDTFWSASFRGAHSGLVVQEGNGSSSESYSTSFGWKRYSISANYSESSGTAVLTSNGSLTAAPLASLITSDLLFFNARSYGVSVSTTWHRRIFFSGGYANVFSSSTENSLENANTGERYSARVEYRLRKFSIIGGFGRSSQALSAIPGGPRVVNSYYLSLSRWFNVF